MKAPELLAPAGTLRHIDHALAFGADAVYAGIPRYSLRVRNNEFHRLETLAEGIRRVHAAGRRFFLAVNVLPHNAKLATFLEDLAPVVALGPDALIMADPGLILLVREQWPEMPVHLSVQANTMNHASVRFWARQGLRRIILSRELSLEEIEEIRQQCPDIELEVFVHGALCIAYSGRCLLSGYFNHRDANQGTCTNACRWDYRVRPGTTDPETGETVAVPTPATALLEEGRRPGEAMPIEEDEHGTYILNSKDLRAIRHVERLVRIGVDSLKIEGRTKSHYYVARVTQAYRRAIDDAVAGRPFDPALLGQLENLSSRGYTEGFLQRHLPPEAHQNYEEGASRNRRQQFVAELLSQDPDSGVGLFEVKNRFAVGDTLELITPAGNRRLRLDTLLDAEGRPVATAPGSGHRVRIPLETRLTPPVLLARELSG